MGREQLGEKSIELSMKIEIFKVYVFLCNAVSLSV